jgi:hypothetical protein
LSFSTIILQVVLECGLEALVKCLSPTTSPHRTLGGLGLLSPTEARAPPPPLLSPKALQTAMASTSATATRLVPPFPPPPIKTQLSWVGTLSDHRASRWSCLRDPCVATGGLGRGEAERADVSGLILALLDRCYRLTDEAIFGGRAPGPTVRDKLEGVGGGHSEAIDQVTHMRDKCRDLRAKVHGARPG